MFYIISPQLLLVVVFGLFCVYSVLWCNFALTPLLVLSSCESVGWLLLGGGVGQSFLLFFVYLLVVYFLTQNQSSIESVLVFMSFPLTAPFVFKLSGVVGNANSLFPLFLVGVVFISILSFSMVVFLSGLSKKSSGPISWTHVGMFLVPLLLVF